MKKVSLALILFILLPSLCSCLGYSDYNEEYEEGYDDGFFEGIDYAHEKIFAQLYTATVSSDNHLYTTEEKKISTPDFNIVFSSHNIDDTVHITCELTLKNQTVGEAYLDECFFFSSYACDDSGNQVKVLYNSDFFDYAAINTNESWEVFCGSKTATARFDTHLSREELRRLDSIIVSNGNIYLVTFVKSK